MSLLAEITTAQITARKEHNAEKLSILQMALSAIKNQQIEKGGELSDEEVVLVLQRQVKQLRDAQNDFKKAQRQDLVDSADTEVAILSHFLPAQMTEEEIRTVCDDVIATVQPNGNADFGKVMGMAMKQLQGKADGTLVQKILKEKLS